MRLQRQGNKGKAGQLTINRRFMCANSSIIPKKRYDLMKNKSIKTLVAAMLIINVSATWAGSCDEYPYSPGASQLEPLSTGQFKIVATDEAKAAFDDVDVISTARDEAELLAKARLTTFIEEYFSSDTSIAKIVEKSSTEITNQEAQNTYKENVQNLRNLVNHSKALLRGVSLLGECYDPAKKLLRVTVGFKSESLAQGGNIAGALSQSLTSKQTMKQSPTNTGSNGSTSNSGNPANNSAPAAPSGNGYSRTEQLKNF